MFAFAADSDLEPLVAEARHPVRERERVVIDA
jgi:hypothetical protein